jgi:hypothetical protein
VQRAVVALALGAVLGCSSTNSEPQNQPTAGSGGTSAGASGAQTGGAGSSSAGSSPQSSGSGGSGETAGSAGLAAGAGVGGAATAGAAGAMSQGGAGGSGGAAGFVCSQVQGLTLTREWYLAGFEAGVVDGEWQMKAAQSAYVDEWAKSDSPFWNTALESPCQNGSTQPDRVVFVVLSWTIMTQEDWRSAVQGAVDAIQAKYPGLRRVDLMTIIRGPDNAACGDPNVYAESTHIPAALDAALAEVAAGAPALVYVAPQFAVDACSDFQGTGPHLTSAGNAKLSAEIAAWASQ